MIGRPADKPLYQWASTDVLAAVIDVEIAAMLGRPPTKDEALQALAARREFGGPAAPAPLAGHGDGPQGRRNLG